MPQPRIADEIKVIKGTFDQSKTNKDQPHPEPDTPEMPEFLRKDGLAKKYFYSLVDMLMERKTATRADGYACGLAALELARVERTLAAVKKDGPYIDVRDKKGNLIKRQRNPAVADYEVACKDAHRKLIELGLTPASRAKVSVVKTVDKKTTPFRILGT